jgi:hypothetical protein
MFLKDASLLVTYGLWAECWFEACGLCLGYFINVTSNQIPNMELEYSVFRRVLSIMWLDALVGADLVWISMWLCSHVFEHNVVAYDKFFCCLIDACGVAYLERQISAHKLIVA